MSSSFVVAVVSIGVAMESFKLESKESSSYETDSFRSKITFPKEKGIKGSFEILSFKIVAKKSNRFSIISLT